MAHWVALKLTLSRRSRLQVSKNAEKAFTCGDGENNTSKQKTIHHPNHTIFKRIQKQIDNRAAKSAKTEDI